jgi:hypothetical protein
MGLFCLFRLHSGSFDCLRGDPNLNVSKREVGDAMRAITRNASTPSNGVSYNTGVQLPLMPDHNMKAYLT